MISWVNFCQRSFTTLVLRFFFFIRVLASGAVLAYQSKPYFIQEYHLVGDTLHIYDGSIFICGKKEMSSTVRYITAGNTLSEILFDHFSHLVHHMCTYSNLNTLSCQCISVLNDYCLNLGSWH
jgi:hypothetical protein